MKLHAAVQRNCACRGTDAGFVHLACLAKYAATRSVQAHNTEEFKDLWVECPSCHQQYRNELAVDIAKMFVLFVQKKYPENAQRKAWAHLVKMCALMDMIEVLQPEQKNEAKITTNELLSLLEQIKRELSPMPPLLYTQMETHAYNSHGRIALNEGTDESARRAVAHWQTSLELNDSIGNIEGIAAVKVQIAEAKSNYESGNNNEEMLKALKELYEIRVAIYGEENESTICAGGTYAHYLQKAHRGGDSRALLTKLLATSKQVFGSNHNATKGIESTLQYYANKDNSDYNDETSLVKNCSCLIQFTLGKSMLMISRMRTMGENQGYY
jgi:hypothetical protein